eukprot:TRINITY_DN11740_c0_g1_i2.p1 TRINITY_DN11740_c0_g1~~TRINITY_DN11740_c0_g1_i2.p1  ORF type:complete len:184 (+),score=29.82 TRINITY_DN11740_c0_g1_i2:74-625(+)
MPKITSGDLWGFQLWINLPQKDKMIKPRYQDYQAEQIPTVSKHGADVRVMAGEFYGTKGPINMRNPGLLMDVSISKGGNFVQHIPENWNGFTYVCNGSGKISDEEVSKEHAYVLGSGDYVKAETDSEDGLRFLLIAGQPIGEPIVQHGPFVMNTQEEIYQAFMDYQTGKLQDPNDNVWDEWRE